MSKLITIQDGQTLRDIAMQYYGCAEGLQRIAALNNLGYQLLQAGGQILIDDVVPQLTDNNLRVLNYYSRFNVTVNSNYSAQLAPIMGGFPYTLPFTLS